MLSKKSFLIIIGAGILTAGFMVFLRYGYKQQHQSIIEINAISEVLKQAHDSRTLVVFDIDNTLVYPEQELGSDPWVVNIVNKKLNRGVDYDTAIAELLPLYFHIHDYTKMQPAEDNTLEILEELQTQNINFIALTTRSLLFVARSLEQLEEAGILFNPPQGFPQETIIQHAKYPAIFSHGIIFCADNDKGMMLKNLYQQLNIALPQRIVYVDDKKKYLEAVARLCEQKHIEFVGLRYGHLDSYIQNFDMKKTEAQLAQLLADHPFGSINRTIAACIN